MKSDIYYLLQEAFTTGEISRDVENRVSLEKYKSALTMAKNVIVKPYGAVVKREGTRFIDYTKDNSNVNLQEFKATQNHSFLLEFGDENLKVRDNGVIVAEIVTPYTKEDINKLNFNQSSDVMIIAHENYPLYTLKRFADDWRFEILKISTPPFEALLDQKYNTEFEYSNYIIKSNHDVFNAKQVGALLTLTHNNPVFELTDEKLNEEQEALYNVTRSNINGKKRITADFRASFFNVTEYSEYYDYEALKEIYKLQDMVSCEFATLGTWTGTVTFTQYDMENKKTILKNYNSKKDFNVRETSLISSNIKIEIESPDSCRVSFKLFQRKTNDYFIITGFTDSKTVEVIPIILSKESKQKTKGAKISSWNESFGYPSTTAFFQDRLVLGGAKNNPFVLWFSKTSDYFNFSVDVQANDITADSAISINLISREEFKIKHIIPATDLIIMTDGNEWLISGSKIITPKEVVARLQTSRGSSDLMPLFIGNRVVFEQRRGGAVRDFGYSYESDNYNGVDLTIFAKHLFSETGVTLTKGAYLQNPDSLIVFVSSSGKVLVLAYIIEQDVFGWTEWKFGDNDNYKVVSVATVVEDNRDILYFAIQWLENGDVVQTTIERLDLLQGNDWSMLDSHVVINNDIPQAVIENLDHLKNKEVNVLYEGSYISKLQVDENGVLVLPHEIKDLKIGLPYKMQVELPNVEIQTNNGSVQSINKNVANVTLRVYDSYGGAISGGRQYKHDRIKYSTQEKFTGDINFVLPNNKGSDTDCKIYIQQSVPFPFNILSVVREIKL